jgi:hypothetical protein
MPYGLPKVQLSSIYVCMKQGSLFWFVMLWFPKPWPLHAGLVIPLESSQWVRVHWLIPLESSQWVRVHWLGLGLFGAMVWKLLIIEPFFQWKLNEIKTENNIGTWECSWCRRVLIGSAQCSKKYWWWANQYGSFKKQTPKKSSCENTHELINMHHTCNMHIPYSKVRKPNNFRQADCNQSITHDSLKNSWITDEEESEIS